MRGIYIKMQARCLSLNLLSGNAWGHSNDLSQGHIPPVLWYNVRVFYAKEKMKNWMKQWYNHSNTKGMMYIMLIKQSSFFI